MKIRMNKIKKYEKKNGCKIAEETWKEAEKIVKEIKEVAEKDHVVIRER